MIDDLDDSLQILLEQEVPVAISEQISVSFATPDDQFQLDVALPAINLFLYDLRENLELRSNENCVERLADGTGFRKRAPVRMDASYLITAWAGSSPKDRSRDEHRLLGEVMQVLLRFKTLPRSALRGALTASTLPLPLFSLQPGRLQSVGEFWQALGGKPKAALNVTVTFSVELADPVPRPLVTEKIVRIFETAPEASS